MVTTFTWLIWNMKRDAVTGSVGEVNYKVKGERDGAQAIYSGSVIFTADPTSSTFIPYEDLTQDTVIEWVKNELDDTKRPSATSIYDELEIKLDTKLASSDNNGTPWSA